MATPVMLKNPTTGVTKTGFYGFSWTSFFFGGFPALIRGDLAIGLGVLVAGVLFGVLGLGLGWFVVGLIWAFIYNKNYTTRLIEQGYKLADAPERNRSAQIALGLGDQAILAAQ